MALTHHNVEVSNHEVRVMDIHVQRRIREDDSSQPPGHEGADQTNAEEHCRSETEVALPQRRDVVEGLDCRRNRNQQRREDEHRAQERIHAGHEHVVSR